MPPAAAPSTLSLVVVPAVLTLIISGLRLAGQINEWNPTVFGRAEAGGGGALLGISWLIFVFGLWFGIRLQRGGAGPRSPARAFGISLFALAVVFGGMAVLSNMDLMSLPDEQHPGQPRGLQWILGLMGVGCLIMFAAWGRAALVLLVYGLLARIPVVLITWFAMGKDWNTHYTKIPPFFTGIEDADRLSFLIMPQITFWPMLTILFGTAMACLGALLFRKRAAA
ncbi:MAG: hypothetical protein MUC36_27125 [Planctomycetes bacterium]|jgi:hypothetical protein|nr:hypothetical protein [Planctomycetota bacterium]